MDKRTLLAVCLSMLVMLVFFMIQGMRTPAPEPASPWQETRENIAPAPSLLDTLLAPTTPGILTPGAPDIGAEFVPLQNVTIETDLVRVVLTNAGGNILSFQLLRHMDGREPVEMIFAGNAQPQAFALAFGNLNDVVSGRVQPVTRNFRVNRLTRYIVEFSQDFRTPTGGQFTLTKRYEFRNESYMFELSIGLTSQGLIGPFDFQGAAYTLIFGPQIGPRFDRLDGRQEYRNFQIYSGGRLRNQRVNDREPTIITSNPDWAAISGKYFSLAVIPSFAEYELAFSTQPPEEGIAAASRLFITRPAFSGSSLRDTFHIYMGPKSLRILNTYERGLNPWRLADTGLFELANTRGFLAPLENILKWLMLLFHRIIPNYGIAIILVTLVVKLVTFPLTKKSSEATLRMQALAPKIKEIQEKYKDNRQKMNAEMAEFYKKEGYNPLSGCLPMLIQLPIFFAMFSLFNNHFELRGAMFIPGWIPDLSAPDSVFNFPPGVVLPLLGWDAIRLLPFIFVGSQLLYGKVVQTPGQQGNPHMKIMLYAMPIVFFFIMYNMPSGLLVYWITQNILTMVQQFGINKYMARKAEAAPIAEAKTSVPPGGAKKKKKK